MKAKISVSKRSPPTCCVCGGVAEYYLSYWDKDRPGPAFDGVHRWATESRWSCEGHIEAGLAILLRSVGLIKEQ